jgi:hypothetical protein
MERRPIRTMDFLQHLRNERAPLVLRRHLPGPEWVDEALHAAAFRQSPERYALCALADQIQPGQLARILFQLLRASWADLSTEARITLERVASVLLPRLTPDAALTVFLALRKVRANHKHTRRVTLGYLLNHPRLEELAAGRRPAVVDVLEHTLGKNVARGCARFLRENGTGDGYARRHLLRFAANSRRAAEVVAFLYGNGPCPAPIARPADLVPVTPGPVAERPKTVTATNRGDISATLVHLYRGGANAELKAALDRYVTEAATGLPRFEGSVALVLDASASTLGYGERQFCCVAQSQALRLVLERCCARLDVHLVGGAGDPPRPEGDTDLASALLDALAADPDVVAVVSDGYENIHSGDLARVAASLPGAGIDTPVVFCHSKFTDKDDLMLRRPAPALPELEFWHQDHFAGLLWSLFAHARELLGDVFLEGQLRRRLEVLESEKDSERREEVRSWSSS